AFGKEDPDAEQGCDRKDWHDQEQGSAQVVVIQLCEKGRGNQEHDGHGKLGGPQLACHCRRPVAKLFLGFDTDVEAAVGKEQQDEQHASQQAVGVQQRQERTMVPCCVHRKTAEDVSEGDAQQKRGKSAPDENAQVPCFFPAGGSDLAPELEGHSADDKRKEKKQQGRIEIAEHEGIGFGERGKGGSTSCQKPDLVAVPDRAHGSDQYFPLAVISPQVIVQHSRAEHEAV